MDRRDFLRISAGSLVGFTLPGSMFEAMAKGRKSCDEEYSVILLGDTHYDKAPVELYHSGYFDPDPVREQNHRKEFKRNMDMWTERCPKLLKRAACLVDEKTRMTIQTGDLIQGDTADCETHVKFLDDTLNMFKDAMGTLPFITVEGNHDIRAVKGVDAVKAYHGYMTARMSGELGQEVTKTTFAYWIGKDAYIVIDFTHPDDAEVEKLLRETKKARYTFIVIHSPIFPFDSSKYYSWIYHGKDKTPDARLHFRKLFARRNAIVLCGHSHFTDFIDWYGDGGRITQMAFNSVWAKPEMGSYKVLAEGADNYGCLRAASKEGSKALFDEYREGIRTYTHSTAAGSYKMKVSDSGVIVEFYAGDSTRVSETFRLR